MRRILVPALALVAGCGGMEKYTSVAMLKDAKYEPTTEVEIFDQKPPSRAFDIIAKLETRIGPDAPLGDLYTSMRERAKSIGADGVIDVVPETDTNVSYGGFDPFGLGGMSTSTERVVTLTGRAIKYK